MFARKLGVDFRIFFRGVADQEEGALGKTTDERLDLF
jgi:hypothetical protein